MLQVLSLLISPAILSEVPPAPSTRFEPLTVLAPAAGGQRIVALRRVAFRDHHTIVLAGYAAERDLPALRALFEASFASLRVGPQE